MRDSFQAIDGISRRGRHFAYDICNMTNNARLLEAAEARSAYHNNTARRTCIKVLADKHDDQRRRGSHATADISVFENF